MAAVAASPEVAASTDAPASASKGSSKRKRTPKREPAAARVRSPALEAALAAAAAGAASPATGDTATPKARGAKKRSKGSPAAAAAGDAKSSATAAAADGTAPAGTDAAATAAAGDTKSDAATPSRVSIRGATKRAKKADERIPGVKCYWLMKSEPVSHIIKGVDVKFGLDELTKMPDQTGHWDGVRSVMARFHLRRMRIGDEALLWHSSCGAKRVGAVAIMKIVREAYTDTHATDPSHPYHDPKLELPAEADKWSAVDVQLVRPLARTLLLSELKGYSGRELSDMPLFKQARLSIQPVTPKQWKFIVDLENKKDDD